MHTVYPHITADQSIQHKLIDYSNDSVLTIYCNIHCM